jgi:hypothetical protein
LQRSLSGSTSSEVLNLNQDDEEEETEEFDDLSRE